LIDLLVESEMLACNTEAHASQPVFIEKLCVVSNEFPLTGLRRFIAHVDTGQRAKKDHGVANSTSHWTGSVLAVRNRNYPGATHQTNRRLDPDERICRRRTHDRSIRLRADCRRTEACGHGDA